MKGILLVNPFYLEDVYINQKVMAVQPPLGLAYLASYVRDHGVDVKILDANALGLSLDQTVQRTVDSPFDCIGFTAVTATINLVYRICDAIREKCDKYLIVGGAHVTFLAEQTLTKCRAINCIVRGEGEETLVDVLGHLEKQEDLGQVLGITYRDDRGEIHTNPDRPFIKNIDDLPFPAWDLLPGEKYRHGPLEDIGFSGKQLYKTISSRGCPNKCTYCSSSHFWKQFRFRSVENIIDELKFLCKTFGAKQIDFMDDCLTIPVGRFSRLCDRIIEERLDIRWFCYSRVNSITAEVVRKMKRAGCYLVMIGIESGCQSLLDAARKNITIDQVRKAVSLIKQEGIEILGFFMFGLPDDTMQTAGQTIAFAKELDLDFPFFSVATPFPGTELYEDMRAQHLLPEDFEWEQLGLHWRTIWRTKALSSEQLIALHDQAMKMSYLTPAYFWKVFRKILKDPSLIAKYYRFFRVYPNI